jgi:hypothetical protein
MRVAQLAIAIAVFVAAVGAVAFTGVTRALFTNSSSQTAAVGAGRIFPGTRTTSAFAVQDSSGGGSPVDRSNPFAVAGDGLTQATGSWSTSFRSARYVQFDLNSPLPGGLAANATFNLQFASSSAGAAMCVYVEVRRTSTGSVLGTYGSSGSPLACGTGTTMTSLTQPLGVVTSTDTANDLSVRVYASDDASSSSSFDLATVSGSTPYAAFTLYPASFTDAADGTAAPHPWALEGP